MGNDKLNYKQYAAFINRETELTDLKTFIDKEPSEILFIHGPKSSGKTTLLYKFIGQVEKEQKLGVKFLNLREICAEFTEDFNYKDFLKMLFNMDDKEEKKEKREFIRLKEKGIKPVLIIDELQALDKIYMNNGRDRQLIIQLFNFFVAMTKESHLAHIIVASSDSYFINTIYTDSRLKKCSEFFKVDYLDKSDVMEWLLNLEKYSKIRDYSLCREDAEKIWDVVGGSMWEIQILLSQLFKHPIDDVLARYQKKIMGMVAYYIGANNKKEKTLKIFLNKETATVKDFINAGIETDEVEELLRDLVRNNILYFDPTEAIYYPQGKSYLGGIRLYFKGSS